MRNTLKIERMVDSKGRVLLPFYIRNAIQLKPFDDVYIYMDGDKIIIEKKEVDRDN